jgi:hypothetical protein
MVTVELSTSGKRDASTDFERPIHSNNSVTVDTQYILDQVLH